MPFKKPEIKTFKLRDTTNVSLPTFINRLVYTDIQNAAASLLDVDFVGGFADTINIYDAIELSFGYTDSGSALTSNRCVIDRYSNRYGEAFEYVGAQAYNYGLNVDLSGSAPDGGTGNTNGEQSVTYNENFSGGGGKINLDFVMGDIASKFNLSLSSGITGIGAHGHGSASTAFFAASSTATTYLELIQRFAKRFGYAFNVKPPPPSTGFAGTLIFKKLKDYDAASSIATLTPASMVSQPEFTRDFSKATRRFIVKYKSNIGAGALTDMWIIDAIDFRVPTSNKSIQDLRNDGYFDEQPAALARLEGAVQEFNQGFHLGKIQTEGNITFVAGANITLSGFKAIDNGLYQITRATHTIDANSRGWITDLDIKKVVTYTIGLPPSGSSIQYNAILAEDWIGI